MDTSEGGTEPLSYSNKQRYAEDHGEVGANSCEVHYLFIQQQIFLKMMRLSEVAGTGR